LLPLNSNLANPYATKALEKVIPITASTVTITEFIKYFVKGCEFQAFAKFSQCISLGKKVGGYLASSPGDFTAVMKAQKSGNKKAMDNTIRMLYITTLDNFDFTIIPP